MRDRIETIYFAVKTLICFAGYVASVLIGQPSETLALVSALSAICFILFALVQLDWN